MKNVATLGLMQPFPVAHDPFIDISMDFIDGLPKYEGKDVIMVVVDCLRKYAYFMSLSHLYSTPMFLSKF